MAKSIRNPRYPDKTRPLVQIKRDFVFRKRFQFDYLHFPAAFLLNRAYRFFRQITPQPATTIFFRNRNSKPAYMALLPGQKNHADTACNFVIVFIAFGNQ